MRSGITVADPGPEHPAPKVVEDDRDQGLPSPLHLLEDLLLPHL